MVVDPYLDRGQTAAKHFILERYLQELAFKILNFSDLTYVDGFSGPWRTQTNDFADSSFMIAMRVLHEAQRRAGKRRRIRCFFVESEAATYAQLAAAVAPFHNPSDGFEIKTFHGRFEDAVSEIQAFVRDSFALTFIDPTGWTGYSMTKIRPLFAGRKREVLINFMYDFVNRFVSSGDERTIASLDPILGGPGWRDRLKPGLARGTAVELLFRETLKSAGGFKFVVSTKIDRSTIERPHFFLAFGTKDRNGLMTFREVEYAALRRHAKGRADAAERKRGRTTGTDDMFAGHDAMVKELEFDSLIDEQTKTARDHLIRRLHDQGPRRFSDVVDDLLETFMLRVTNVKDLCVDLAAAGVIENTWGGHSRKPKDQDMIRMAGA